MNPPFSPRALAPNLSLAAFAVLSLAVGMPGEASAQEPEAAKPLRALRITGGCCHDYEKQKMILSAGIRQRAKVGLRWATGKLTAEGKPAAGYDANRK